MSNLSVVSSDLPKLVLTLAHCCSKHAKVRQSALSQSLLNHTQPRGLQGNGLLTQCSRRIPPTAIQRLTSTVSSSAVKEMIVDPGRFSLPLSSAQLSKPTASSKKIKRSLKRTQKISPETEQNVYRCTTFSTSQLYNLSQFHSLVKLYSDYKEIERPIDSEGVLIYETASELSSDMPGIFFLFEKEGTVVFWNVREKMVHHVLKDLLKHCSYKPYPQKLIEDEFETMYYTFSDKTTRLENENIILHQLCDFPDKILNMYAFSNALALSVKLGVYESQLDEFSDSIEGMLKGLGNTGKIPKFPVGSLPFFRKYLLRKFIMKKTGELFLIRQDINLRSDLLQPSDFYWDREDLDKLYRQMLSFLSVPSRTKVANIKSELCNESIQVVRQVLEQEQSVRLEILIIILILIEVIIEFSYNVERWYGFLKSRNESFETDNNITCKK